MYYKNRLNLFLTSTGFDEMSRKGQKELLRTFISAAENRLFELQEDVVLFEQDQECVAEQVSVRKGGVEVTVNAEGIAVEVFDYHAGRTELKWEEFGGAGESFLNREHGQKDAEMGV